MRRGGLGRDVGALYAITPAVDRNLSVGRSALVDLDFETLPIDSIAMLAQLAGSSSKDCVATMRQTFGHRKGSLFLTTVVR